MRHRVPFSSFHYRENMLAQSTLNSTCSNLAPTGIHEITLLQYFNPKRRRLKDKKYDSRNLLHQSRIKQIARNSGANARCSNLLNPNAIYLCTFIYQYFNVLVSLPSHENRYRSSLNRPKVG